MVQRALGVRLAGKLLSKVGLASSARGCRVTTLDHEALHEPVKDRPIVVVTVRQLDEVLDCGWSDTCVQLKRQRPQTC